MSIPPPSVHDGSLDRPEVPAGVVPAPLPVRDDRDGLPPWPWWAPSIIAALLVALLIPVVILEATGNGADEEAELSTASVVIFTLFQDALILGLTVGLAWSAGGRRPTWADFGLRRTGFWSALGLTVALFVGFFIVSAIYAAALGIEEGDDLATDLGADESVGKAIAVGLLVCVAAPITEEIFFRGFLFAALWKRFGWVAGALVSGLIFGFIHVGGTAAHFLPLLALLGVLFAVLYRVTGSLLPCIGLHALNNAIALGVSLDWPVWQVLTVAVLAPTLLLAALWPVTSARRLRLAPS
jgi:uncharacterized protein